MRFVISDLFLSTTVCLVNSRLHRSGYLIGIEYGFTVYMARSTTNCLGQTTFIAQEAFLVSIQNSHETHFRQIQSLTQKIHTD